ncbi:MAG: GGDEF domain-containing protein [Pseudomonadota bacterium]
MAGSLLCKRHWVIDADCDNSDLAADRFDKAARNLEKICYFPAEVSAIMNELKSPDLGSLSRSPLQSFNSIDDRTVYGLAGRTFDLLHKHETPPDPRAYAVLFSYAAKSNDQIISAVEDLLSDDRLINRDRLVQLFDEHFNTNAQANFQKNISQELAQNISEVDELVGKGADQSRKFERVLHQTNLTLDSIGTPDEIKRVTHRLMDENKEMMESNLKLGEGLLRSLDEINNLTSRLNELEAMALRDPLTGLPNRRAFDTQFKEEAECASSGRPLCVALMDIDHFKRVNDLFGHPTGDRVLIKMSEILSAFAQDDKFVARLGGEEFAILMPNTDISNAHNKLVSLRWQISKTKFLSQEDHKRLGFISASFGQSVYKKGQTTKQLLECADRKLYEAKRAGRNTVSTEGISKSPSDGAHKRRDFATQSTI